MIKLHLAPYPGCFLCSKIKTGTKKDVIFLVQFFTKKNTIMDIKNYRKTEVKRKEFEQVEKELRDFLKNQKDKEIRKLSSHSLQLYKKALLEDKKQELNTDLLDFLQSFILLQKALESAKKSYGIKRNEIESKILVEQDWTPIHTLFLVILGHFHNFASIRLKHYELEKNGFIPIFEKGDKTKYTRNKPRKFLNYEIKTNFRADVKRQNKTNYIGVNNNKSINLFEEF